jgi:hypothetical protein
MTALRLLAEDEEDLNIVSAHLQDAVIRIGDLAYLPKQHRFAALVNRFCWEGCPEGQKGTRVQSGLHFDTVLNVQSNHVRRDDPNAVVELLAIKFSADGGAGGGGGGAIELLLAGGGRIKLDVECIDVQLRDMTAPRPAVARPAHDLERG